MFSHSCTSCQGVVTKFTIYSRRFVYNWVMWVQICNRMIGLLAFITKIWPCIRVIFMQMLYQSKSGNHYILTDKAYMLLRSSMIHQNCIFWLRSLHQVLCFSLSPQSHDGGSTWRGTLFHCWATPPGWHGWGLRGGLRDHIVFWNCFSLKCAHHSRSIRSQSYCHKGRVNTLLGCAPNFVLLNHVDRSLQKGWNKPQLQAITWSISFQMLNVIRHIKASGHQLLGHRKEWEFVLLNPIYYIWAIFATHQG